MPFCLHKCGYCDFTVLAGRDDLSGAYLEAIRRELQTLGQPAEVDTIFIGGGTPTHLSRNELRQLCDLITHWLPLAEGGEWSIEANPYELVARADGLPMLDDLAAAGVTRVSLGVQAFDAAVLRMLERDHSPEQAAAACRAVADRFGTWSLDLIFGVPGQTESSWAETLTAAIGQRPPHVSAYGLTFEKGTAFWSRRLRGDLVESPDETQRRMQAAAMDRLPATGLDQYEISNYARPGHRCRHNETYWRGGDFYGFGPGAASLRANVRQTNHRSATTYFRRMLAGESAVMESETLDVDTQMRERILLRLRHVDGLDLARFVADFGRTVDSFAPGVAAECEAAGWIDSGGDRLRLTREGRFVADEVVSRFF